MFSPANSNAARSSRQNHHQRSCCRIAAGSTSKEGSGTQTSNHQNRVMLFYAILKKHTCSPRPLNVWQRLTLALAIALLFLPAPWLKPGRPHLFGWLLLFAGSLQSSQSNIACRPWWRRTPPLPNHRQPRSRCANLLRSSLVTNSRWSGLGGVLTQVRHRCTSQTSAYSTQAHPTVCTVPAVDLTTSRPRIAAKQSPPAPCSMCQGRCGAVWGWGLACKALRRGQSNFNWINWTASILATSQVLASVLQF